MCPKTGYTVNLTPRRGGICFRSLIGIALVLLTAFAAVTGTFAGEDVQHPKKLLKEILAGSEFQDTKGHSILGRLLTEIVEGIRRIVEFILGKIPNMPEIEADGDAAFAVLTVVLWGVLLALVVYLGYSMYGGEPMRRWTRVSPSEFNVPGSDESLRGDELRETADSLAREGRYSQALSAMYRWTLTRLDDMGVISLRRGLTNREILRALKNQQDRGRVMAEMVPLFNRVRFGGVPCNKQEYDRFSALCRQLTGDA